MKKVLGILAILSLLMVPCVSMAATMSDADLAAVTGQSGVTIDVSSLNLGLYINSLTWGDLDGFSLGSNASQDWTNAGFVNIEFYPAQMHIGVSGLNLKVDVGTTPTTSITAVNLSGTMSGVNNITVDAIIADIYLDGTDAVHTDYVGQFTTSTSYTHVASAYNTVPAGNGTATTLPTSKLLGRVGISGIGITIPSFNVQISAH